MGGGAIATKLVVLYQGDGPSPDSEVFANPQKLSVDVVSWWELAGKERVDLAARMGRIGRRGKRNAVPQGEAAKKLQLLRGRRLDEVLRVIGHGPARAGRRRTAKPDGGGLLGVGP